MDIFEQFGRLKQPFTEWRLREIGDIALGLTPTQSSDVTVEKSGPGITGVRLTQCTPLGPVITNIMVRTGDYDYSIPEVEATRSDYTRGPVEVSTWPPPEGSRPLTLRAVLNTLKQADRSHRTVQRQLARK